MGYDPCDDSSHWAGRMKSPCIKVCQIKDGKCVGCGRTTEQITKWAKYSDSEREVIMQRIKDG